MKFYATALNNRPRRSPENPEHFSRFFKTKTGVNFVDFLNDIRLGHAARLLIDTKDSIAEIASACGFTNISNFNRTFKRQKGLTPKDFRHKHGNVGERIFF